MLQSGGLTGTNDLDPRLDRQFAGAPSQTVDADTADPVRQYQIKPKALLFLGYGRTKLIIKKQIKKQHGQGGISCSCRTLKAQDLQILRLWSAEMLPLLRQVRLMLILQEVELKSQCRKTYIAGAGRWRSKRKKRSYFRGLKPSSAASSTSSCIWPLKMQ